MASIPKVLIKWWPKRHQIRVTSGGERSFGLRVRAKWWPPFAATDFFAPRYEIEVTNPGPDAEGINIQVAVAPYSGNLEELPQLPYQWREMISYKPLGPLKNGHSRTMHVTIPTGLLEEGTHVVRLHIMVDSTVGLPKGQRGSSSAAFAWLQEYLRVQPLSSVLTLIVALGTLLTALATLGLVLLT